LSQFASKQRRGKEKKHTSIPVTSRGSGVSYGPASSTYAEEKDVNMRIAEMRRKGGTNLGRQQEVVVLVSSNDASVDSAKNFRRDRVLVVSDVVCNSRSRPSAQISEQAGKRGEEETHSWRRASESALA
jgi:hypothetical protein